MERGLGPAGQESRRFADCPAEGVPWSARDPARISVGTARRIPERPFLASIDG